MNHRHLSGKMGCGLSKWDTGKANRLLIHVLIWWLFLSLLSHFHFKCQRTSFGLCLNTPHGDREEAVTDCDADPEDPSLVSASAVNSSASHHEYRPSKQKAMCFLILSPTWEWWKEGKKKKQNIFCKRRWEVMCDGGRVKAREAKEKDSQHRFICQGVGWCKQTQSLCKLLILWTVKSSWWKQEN